jgi:aryl-alcohol dehydrogenase-like predicted oxidoreductase
MPGWAGTHRRVRWVAGLASIPMSLEIRDLGRTGERVTTLGYGAMELRGEPRGPAVSDETAEEILNAVLDSGINVIDTSIDYGNSEELIGRYISHRRGEYFLASKCGCMLGDPPPGMEGPPFPHDFSKENVRGGIEQSLRRLNTDHLDLLQVHISPSRETLETEGTIEVMQELQDEGKIRFLGMSGTIPNLADHIAMGVFDVFQIPWSALQREHEALIQEASQQGAGIVIRGGVARGAPAAEKNWVDPIGLGAGEGKRRWENAELDEFIGEMGEMAFLLRYTLSLPELDTTIVGTSSVDHFQSNLAAALEGPLPEDVYEAARERFAQAGSTPS